ncbi:hypothetical protein [Streptomyces sp. TRM49041]|uniref:hypothetical protein n=1 Tax=Streptomyces sp. TRM49041 TaxID=2603216 RepID=UPI0016568B0A|nr:hypothetical protein [Streptomyces sp. TRM49041]
MPRRRLLLSAARSSVTVVLSAVVYHLVPLDKGPDIGTAIVPAVSPVLFAGVLAWQVCPRSRATTRMGAE